MNNQISIESELTGGGRGIFRTSGGRGGYFCAGMGSPTGGSEESRGSSRIGGGGGGTNGGVTTPRRSRNSSSSCSTLIVAARSLRGDVEREAGFEIERGGGDLDVERERGLPARGALDGADGKANPSSSSSSVIVAVVVVVVVAVAVWDE